MAKNAKISTTINANDTRLFSPKNMIKTIQNICSENGGKIPQKPAELAAVIYNSLAKSYAQTAAELEEISGRKYEKICIVGGGANAEYLNDLTAKFCEKEIIVGAAEATAIGNLAAQMISAGIFADLKAARACIKN
jgi:rhamnulokinase